MKAFRNLRTIGALLLFVIVAGTAGYHYIEGWSWFDGFYMVVTTLTTIGYPEGHPLSQAGRIFNVFVILGGVSLLALGVGAMSQALLEFELQASSEGGAWSAKSDVSTATTSSAAWVAWDAAWRGSWRVNRCRL
jgi:hypothetical protein